MGKELKVALAHDFLNQWGGAERVTQLFHEIYPQADIFTTTYDSEKVTEFAGKNVITSFIQRLPRGKTNYKWYLALMPKAIESLDFSGYDLVLSDSSGFMKGIRVPKTALHVCYMHTTTRYLTVDADYFRYTAPKITWPIVPFLFAYLKRKDKQGALSPDVIIANSEETKRRIETWYERKVDEVIFPPVDTKHFYRKSSDKVEDYYLTASRLVPYKRVDLAIHACNALGRRLIVMSSGPDEAALKAIAGPTIEFTGKVTDEEMRKLFANCKAMIFPPLEDAGMTPLEAMACGRPVLAYGKGGVLESITEGVSGLFFKEQTPEAIIELITKFEAHPLDSEKEIAAIMAAAEAFRGHNFKRKIQTLVNQALTARNHKGE